MFYLRQRSLVWPSVAIARNVTIGRETYVREHSKIDSDCKIGSHCRIGRRVKIGKNSVIADHVRIGNDCIIESNSVVSQNLPSRAVFEGSPGKIVKLCGKPPAARHQPSAVESLHTLIENYEFDTVLDVGSGGGWHTNQFKLANKKVTCIDFGKSEYFHQGPEYDLVVGDFLSYVFEKKFDCIWASHVLEHQPDSSTFLKKIFSLLPEGGILAVSVPPLKNDIVGGHVTLWNAGLLLYQLIHAGFNCRNAAVKTSGYNITVIVRKETFDMPELSYDIGDIERLCPFFPVPVEQGFDGDIPELNWPSPKEKIGG